MVHLVIYILYGISPLMGRNMGFMDEIVNLVGGIPTSLKNMSQLGL